MSAMPDFSTHEAQRRVTFPLQTLNFFVPQMQTGIGPFLGVFLLAHGWSNSLIGAVISIGGIAGMLATTPAGALIDASSRKRLYVIVPGICAVLTSALVLFSQSFAVVSGSQIISAIAGAAIGPALNGITLGIVHQSGFNRQMGINQAFNHAGNMAGAGLSGLLGWHFGMTAVVWLAALFGVLAIVSAALIPATAIDDRIARGIHPAQEHTGTISGYKVLLECKPLLILAAALCLFHLGNAAMMPLYGMAVVTREHANAPGFVATTIVVAQGTMILMALVASRLGEKDGLWVVLLISFAALPVRGVMAAFLTGHWGVYPVQFLDGIGAGLQSVAVPALVARILNGTGRINAGQGAVMTAQGIGASLSPAIGGWMSQELGYDMTFVVLGCFALASVALWIGFRAPIRAAAVPVDEHEKLPQAASRTLHP